MKNRKKFLLLILFFCLGVIGNTRTLFAAENTDDIFKELYWCEDNHSSSMSGDDKSPFQVYRMKLLDAKNHIYSIIDEKTNGYGVNASPYSSRSFNNSGDGFAGVFVSDTARVISLTNWCNKENTINTAEVDREKSYALPEDLTDSKYSYNKEQQGKEHFKAFMKTEGNRFNTLGTDKLLGRYDNRISIYTMTVEDQGQTTECIMLLWMYGPDYEAYDAEGRWFEKDSMSDIHAQISLYDATDGKCNKLEETYQYGKNLSWQRGEYTSGLEEGALKPYSDITIPSDVKSVRLSYTNPITKPETAIFKDMPGVMPNDLDVKNKKMMNYSFYRGKNRMVSINGCLLYTSLLLHPIRCIK